MIVACMHTTPRTTHTCPRSHASRPHHTRSHLASTSTRGGPRQRTHRNPSSPAAAMEATPTAEGAGIAAAVRSGLGNSATLAATAATAASAMPPPPHTPLVGCEAGSFAEATITTRLPAILASMIADVESEAAAAAAAAGHGPEATAAQVAAGLSELRALRDAMLNNAPLPPLVAAASAPAMTQVLLDAANACVELATARQAEASAAAAAAAAAAVAGSSGCSGRQAEMMLQPTWLGLPWLLVECYMYGAIHAAMTRQPALAGLDPFHKQKVAGWRKSAAAAADLAAETEALLQALHTAAAHGGADGDGDGDGDAGRQAAAKAACLAALQMALWGNKADLSLLVNAAGLDAAALGLGSSATSSTSETSGISGAAAAQQQQHGHGQGQGRGQGPELVPASHVIVDHSEAVWGAMRRLRSRRLQRPHSGSSSSSPVCVDVVLDNSGLELFADLCLADLLLEAGVADRVVLHGKQISWFVSDTLRPDLDWLLAHCAAEQAPDPDKVSAAAWEPVRRLAARWRAHLAAGRWSWAAHPFWTTPVPYCWMPYVAPDLYGQLAASDLVVLKGDLNYRKLTHDCRWPHDTPFEESLQGFKPAPLVALRTCKADVVAGLAPGQSQALTAADADWLVDGKWGMVQAAWL
ncbi:hypothetical protein CHLRE_03g154700v5 [Chlamydomonas reinhardtii]|uniref:Damage-control phosphatase ARMT1-like metal-binding domain-containing protein n=1 Tax=Chlamydomonas reinhardtii TaxID=3055 RepID=A0A2K3DVZ1_CHLRE|nr:uncharacterized protein CHLRE_03g154700v5 [Chlamydomonas reinhardtii]PNW84689.1 hypothetical protein CHLRE_03g154700v5 [Chlamydomonas reinhardtii]